MRIHLVGIGGIGISALARLYMQRGDEISGTEDNESPETLDELRTQGINISQDLTTLPEADMYVYSDAWPAKHPQVVDMAHASGAPTLSYFEALGEVSKDKKTIAVAGVHGKTTTTALLTKVLKDNGANPIAIIGSLVPEFNNSNFVNGGELFVVEACEYKDHLLKLSPEVLVITNLEWDHTDWFKTFEDMQETFRKAIEKVPEHGAIVTNPHNPNIAPLLPQAKAAVIDYTKETVPELELIGEFNQMNARAAKAAARFVSPDVPESEIDMSLSIFKGTWRRFEKKGETKNGALVYDDYAHHPTAIASTLKGVKEKFPGKRIVVAFHPHLYSRTRDLMSEFAQSFVDADEVIIAPIYAAREEPVPGVTAEVLAEKIVVQGVSAVGCASLDEVFETLKSFDNGDTILITMGAGDIYKVAEKLV